jgi:hypothetical protein
MIALQKDYVMIICIYNPSEEICWFALKQNIRAILHIINPTLDMCKYVVKQDGEALKYINLRNLGDIDSVKLCSIALYEAPFQYTNIEDKIDAICKGYNWENHKDWLSNIKPIISNVKSARSAIL